MTKKKWIIIIISLVLVIGVSVGAYVYFFTNAFKPLLSEVLGYEGKTITKIGVRVEDRVEKTTNPDDITEIITAFEGIKVIDSEELDLNRDGGGALVHFYTGEDEYVCGFAFYGNIVISGNMSYTVDKVLPDSFRKYIETKYKLF